MKILITGASGLVGKELGQTLRNLGHEVIPLVRNRAQSGIYWQPDQAEIDLAAMEGADAVIHLAGESIAAKRWTSEFKDRILNSRVKGTTLLAESLKKLSRPPKKFISASAVGFYADGGSQALTENSPSDQSFLSKVCVAWEKAAQLAAPAVPVTTIRIGVVLTNEGGALEKMLPPFRLGLGGKMGDGQQFMPWIDLRDLCAAIEFLIRPSSAAGVYNLSAPQPVTQEAFASLLSALLHRPNFVHTPKWLVRATLGEMADELLLKSLRVVPENLIKAGFQFENGSLENSLRHWI